VHCGSLVKAQRTLCKESLNSDGQEEFEDTKEVIRIRISKKNRRHIGQKQKYKQRSTKHTHNTKDRVRRTPLVNSGAPEG
jgi:hypothetical protein